MSSVVHGVALGTGSQLASRGINVIMRTHKNRKCKKYNI